MRILALVLVCALCRQDGTFGGSLHDFGSSQWTHTTGQGAARFLQLLEAKRGDVTHLLTEDSNLCLSLREDQDHQQLLCNDQRSKFNFNTFGLRFGKRYSTYPPKGARTRRLRPFFLYPRELEVS
ncbi:kisspeptin 2 [Lampris incognitus]|uniref:kisspeptin 2 n=1 Tax=Lampris incognitus TaxID=2546036 RepID=UPI0024B4A735|nr:kisspeptin 2 [Lampris incognitus]